VKTGAKKSGVRLRLSEQPTTYMAGEGRGAGSEGEAKGLWAGDLVAEHGPGKSKGGGKDDLVGKSLVQVEEAKGLANKGAGEERWSLSTPPNRRKRQKGLTSTRITEAASQNNRDTERVNLWAGKKTKTGLSRKPQRGGGVKKKLLRTAWSAPRRTSKRKSLNKNKKAPSRAEGESSKNGGFPWVHQPQHPGLHVTPQSTR